MYEHISQWQQHVLEADRMSVAAASYEVRAELYSSSSAELFWNVTKRFVLIWKDDEIIARTEGNSFLINAEEHGPGQYFLTKDYFGEFPSNNKPFEFTGGTLNRSNVVDLF